MRILAHRGYWKKKSEQNTLNALIKGLIIGDGIEFDIRDHSDEIVISHDISHSYSLYLEELFVEYNKQSLFDKYLAINIKSDGLKNKLGQLIKKHHIKNYYLFDMSVPEMVQYAKNKFNFLTRLSNIETNPVLFKESSGLWIDNFKKSNFNKEIIDYAVAKSKFITFVSPELHQLDFDLWKKIKLYNNYDHAFLCTDMVLKAKNYFNKP